MFPSFFLPATVIAQDLTTSHLGHGHSLPASLSLKPFSTQLPEFPFQRQVWSCHPSIPLESCLSPRTECEKYTGSSIPSQAPGPTPSDPDTVGLSPGRCKLSTFTPVIPTLLINTSQHPGWSLHLAWAMGSQILSPGIPSLIHFTGKSEFNEIMSLLSHNGCLIPSNVLGRVSGWPSPESDS